MAQTTSAKALRPADAVVAPASLPSARSERPKRRRAARPSPKRPSSTAAVRMAAWSRFTSMECSGKLSCMPAGPSVASSAMGAVLASALNNPSAMCACKSSSSCALMARRSSRGGAPMTSNSKQSFAKEPTEACSARPAEYQCSRSEASAAASSACARGSTSARRGSSATVPVSSGNGSAAQPPLRSASWSKLAARPPLRPCASWGAAPRSLDPWPQSSVAEAGRALGEASSTLPAKVRGLPSLIVNEQRNSQQLPTRSEHMPSGQ
mmetsp:Transcript_106578/g.286784  ORF Transcript_106578/g.286784 Transcript_106578/m.286784 type:complete len:266 (-) Transcript_106578:517-1314(-)